jgi:hypothetical protein
MHDADDVRATPACGIASDERPREDTCSCWPRFTLRASVSGISLRPVGCINSARPAEYASLQRESSSSTARRRGPHTRRRSACPGRPTFNPGS